MEKAWKWVKIALIIVGLFVVLDYLFDYNNGVVTLNLKEIFSCLW